MIRDQEEAVRHLLAMHRQELEVAMSEHFDGGGPDHNHHNGCYLNGRPDAAALDDGAEKAAWHHEVIHARSNHLGPRIENVSFVRIAAPETKADELFQTNGAIAVTIPAEAQEQSERSERSGKSSENPLKSGRTSQVSAAVALVEDTVEEVAEFVDYGHKLLQDQGLGFKELDLIVGVLIAINTIVMMIRNEYLGYEAGVQLGQMDSNPLSGLNDVLMFLERGFAIVFLIELVIRILVLRCQYFCSLWNWFDVILVLISMFDLFLLEAMMIEYEFTVNVTMMRLARTVKLARAFRIMRTLRMFEGLRVLVHSVSAFLPSLMWAMIFLGLFIIAGGILLGGLLHGFTVDPTSDPDLQLWTWRHYGTASRAIYTMFEITFAGSWPLYARPVIEDIAVGYSLFFVAYIVFVVFAVIRVISAIFLKETLDAAQNDAQLVVREKAKASQEYVKRLNKVFRTMDVSQDGVVSKEEFLQLCQDPTIRSYMTSLDVDVNDGSHLFKLLDDGDGNLTYDEFIGGMMRFKGSAKAIDVIYLQREVEWLQMELLRLSHAIIGPNEKDPRHQRAGRRHSGLIRAKTEDVDKIATPEVPHELLHGLLKK